MAKSEFGELAEFSETMAAVSAGHAELDQLLADRQRNVEDKKTLEARIKQMDEEIAGIFFAAGWDKYANAAVTVSLQTRTSKTIKAELLVGQGVLPSVIAQATVETVSDPFVSVRARKSED